MNIFEKIGAFAKQEWTKITGTVEAAIPVVETKLEVGATVANDLTNALKNYVNSPQGKTISEVISLVPGIAPYEQAVLNFLPTLVQATGWAKAEFTKSPADLVVEGVTAAVSASLPDVKATNLITLAAHLNTLFTGLSIQGSTTQAAAVHDGVSVVTEVAPATA
jgi:hypothetical protein